MATVGSMELVYSPPPPRYASSTTVEQVFIGSAPAYVCVACTLPFLYPSRGTERWQRAVRAGVINDPDAVAFLSSVCVRMCSLSGGTDSNGVALGTCSSCYAHVLPSGKGRGQECHSVLHSSVSTNNFAKYCPGPAALPFLWVPDKARAQHALAPSQRDKVCSACKSKAEGATRAARRHPTGVPTAVGRISGPPLTQARWQECSIVGVAVEPNRGTPWVLSEGPTTSIAPDSGTVEELLIEHIRRERPEEISVSFVNGRKRMYRRVVQGVKADVGPRQHRRRRAATAALVSARLAASPASITTAMAAVYRRAQSAGGAVGPFFSLSVRKQTEFKATHRISGVTWAHIRSFLGGRSSGLASREALMRDRAAAAGERGAAVTTDETGAYLVSPRAAVQALLDNLVAQGIFEECPVRDPSSSSRPIPVTSAAEGEGAGGGAVCAATARRSSLRLGGGFDIDLPGQLQADWALGGYGPRPALGAPGGTSPTGAADVGADHAAGRTVHPSDPALADVAVTPRQAGDDLGSGSPSRTVGGLAAPGRASPTAPATLTERRCGHSPQHAAATDTDVSGQPPILLCFGMDKGGRESTVKVWLGIANQRCAAGTGSSVASLAPTWRRPGTATRGHQVPEHACRVVMVGGRGPCPALGCGGLRYPHVREGFPVGFCILVMDLI
ncbi:hypothetical protein I4F81_003578 [Pyropia yezoensis]|uniref:Uncharacterized protein n=1 Tax=Pyropia yezoensis TaxID=2788 RepID=A0ACC3BSZ8_PYRYE|nr:hypothetical protein I4F81_003578 [Neopyropia yezoensis]